MSGKITALEVQVGNTERVNVYIDDTFAFGLNQLDAALLRKGQELSEQDIAALKAKDEVARGLDQAVRFLVTRPRSISEVRQRLEQKGISPLAIDEIIDRLKALNYVDDLAFARYWVDNRCEFDPRGERALRYELRQKGIEGELIDEILSTLDSESLAFRAAQKRARTLRGKDAMTIRRKLGEFLIRRGFDYETVQTVVERIIHKFQAPDDDF
jgi:regulatory protein